MPPRSFSLDLMICFTDLERPVVYSEGWFRYRKSLLRAASVIADTAGCLMRRSAEIR